MRAGNPGVPTTSEWLNDVLAPGGRVGIDPVSNSLLLYYLLFFAKHTLLLKMATPNFLFMFLFTVQSIIHHIKC